MKKVNLCKNPRKIGEISRHQWGVVVDRGGGAATLKHLHSGSFRG
jgi:hypothetical protein